MTDTNPFSIYAEEDGENPFSIYGNTEDKEEEEQDALLPEIDVSENMYDSFATIDEAQAYYNKIIERDENGNILHPDVSVVNDSPSIMPQNKVYVYTNPNTGERNAIYRPNRSYFGLSNKPTVNAFQLAVALNILFLLSNENFLLVEFSFTISAYSFLSLSYSLELKR